MLRLLLGQTGTGKTERVLREVKEAVGTGEILLIVPEHASFEVERRVSEAVCGTDALRVKVLSFPRLAENIFRDCGGLAHRALDDMSRIVIMRMAVSEVAGHLTVYQRQLGYGSFLTALLDEIGELKRAGISAETLETMLAEREDDALSAKLRDIELIYAAYQAMVERSFHDPLDDVELACRLAQRDGWFRNRKIWLDGFDYFSVNERKMLETMLTQAQDVTFSVTADGLDGDQDIFIYQKKFLRRLLRFAADHNIKVETPVILDAAPRYQNEDLQILRDTFIDATAAAPLCGDAVQVWEAETPYEEIRAVAAEICRLVRQEGYRYQDCAVLCRDLDRYEGARFLFQQYGIPYFCSEKDNLLSHALPTFLCAALKAACGTSLTDNLLCLARSEASGISVEDAGRLENYCYIWSIKGKAWSIPFTNNPEGMSDAPPEQYAAAAARIEKTRSHLMSPLNELRDAIQQCDGAGFAKALYTYIEKSGAIENLSRGLDDAAGEQLDREWNCIVDILDLFSDFFSDCRLTAQEYEDLFSLALSRIDLGNVPNTIDHVILAEADRVRLQSPRAVFVLGVNEGIFPANSSDMGLFSTREREELNARGIEVPVSGAESSLREQFILYMAMSSAASRLYVTYAGRTLQGEGELQPSVLLKRLINRLSLPIKNVRLFPEELFTVNLRTAKMQLSRCMAEKNEAVPTLEELLRENGAAAYEAALQAAAQNTPAPDIRPESAKALLGESISLSPTAIDSFYQCPYLYFCDKMLRLRPRQKVEYSPFESGSAIHYVFEKMVSRHGSKQLALLSNEECDREIGEYLEEYIRLMVPNPDTVTARFRYQFGRLRLMLRIILRHMAEELAQSDFVTAATEVKVGEGGKVSPPPLQTQAGTTVQVRGSIDRVDLYRTPDTTYLRVIDYKSGEKEFDPQEVEYGLNMQMLVYLYAACDDLNRCFGEACPAGILYVPSKLRAVETAADATEQTLQKEIDADLRMKGLVLENEEVLRAMEKELEGRFIPVSLTAKGTYSKNSRLGDEAQFNRLHELVRGNITQMAQNLEDGRVSPNPIRNKNHTPCDYCPYSALCNNNTPEGRCRVINKSDEPGKGEES